MPKPHGMLGAIKQIIEDKILKTMDIT